MTFTWLKKVAGRAKQKARSDQRIPSRWKRADLQLERLEDRSLLTTFTVGGVAPNFATIQAAINSGTVANGDTLALRPVLFVVDAVAPQPAGSTVFGNFVNKSLTFIEDPANPGTATIAPPPSGTLADSASNSSFGGTSINGFIVAANNVTFTSTASNKIVVDGQANGNGTSNFRNGIITDFRNSDVGNVVGGNFSNLTVSGVTVQNILRRRIIVVQTELI